MVGLEETTYLTVVCPLAAEPEFIGAFAAAVEAALQDLGVPDETAEIEARAIVEDARFAKNDNRSLLGSVKDVAFHTSVLLEKERHVTFAALRRIQAELNHMPHVHREPAFPDQAIRFVFGEAHFT